MLLTFAGSGDVSIYERNILKRVNIKQCASNKSNFAIHRYIDNKRYFLYRKYSYRFICDFNFYDLLFHDCVRGISYPR